MDIEGFLTRFKHYVNVTNPATLIYSEERILQAKAALQDGTSKDPQFDQKLVDAAVHPVTGEVIPKLFRVSAIAPVNIPLISAMLSCPASNVPGTLFLHWINQSYNTACNYANRSGSDQSVDQLLKAYGLAVTSACSLAYGLGKVIEHGPPILRTSGAIIPCIATAAANCSNIGFTRMNEITSGTTVFDKYGKVSENQVSRSGCISRPYSPLLLTFALLAICYSRAGLSLHTSPGTRHLGRRGQAVCYTDSVDPLRPGSSVLLDAPTIHYESPAETAHAPYASAAEVPH